MKTVQPAAPSFRFYLNVFFCVLYLLVEFIPAGGAIDVIGPQWLYAGILDLIVLFSLLYRPTEETKYKLQLLIKSPAIICYIIFFFFAFISGLSAMNFSEWLVNISRLIIALIALLNIALLLNDRRMIPILLQFVALVAFLRSLQAVGIFFSDYPTQGINAAINNMKADTGNKNVMAALLVIKIPAVLYCIQTFKFRGKIFYSFLFGTVLYATWLMNARTSFLSVIAITILFILFEARKAVVNKKSFEVWQNVLMIVAVFVISFFASELTLKKAVAEAGNDSGYGTAAERLGSIKLTNQASSGRFQIWNNGLQLIKDKPLTGFGLGNWKVASVKYEKYQSQDFAMSYHAHNDFLEAAVETGIVGAFSFLMVFVFIAWASGKFLFSTADENDKTILFIGSLGVLCYFIDACFNFPAERTATQLALMFSLGIFFLPLLKHPLRFKKLLSTRLYLFITCLLLLPALYVTYAADRSMVVQALVYPDMNVEKPVNNFEINEQFPSVPDLTQDGIPISGIKARYLLLAGKYNEAAPLIEKAIHDQPYLMYGERLKAALYLGQNNYDSAFMYAAKAFENRPLNYSVYKTAFDLGFLRRDTAYLSHAFELYDKYSKKPEAARNYLAAMKTLGVPASFLLPKVERLSKQYSKDSIPFETYVTPVSNSVSKGDKSVASPAAGTNIPATENIFKGFTEGSKLFNEKNYTAAIAVLEKVVNEQSNFYPAVENLAMSYYAMNDFRKALGYFKKVADNKWTTDGKSELFTGICLLNTGKQKEGCKYFQLSNQKGYYDAPRLIKLHCK